MQRILWFWFFWFTTYLSESESSPGWWFGTFGLFLHMLGIIIPTDFHIFQRGWNHQPAKVAPHSWLLLGSSGKSTHPGVESDIGPWDRTRAPTASHQTHFECGRNDLPQDGYLPFVILWYFAMLYRYQCFRAIKKLPSWRFPRTVLSYKPEMPAAKREGGRSGRGFHVERQRWK